MFCLRKIFPTFFVISTFIANSNNFALAEIGYTFTDGAFLKGKLINGTDDNNKNSHNEQKKQTNNGERNNQDSPTKNGGYDKNKTGSVRNKIRLKINGMGEFQYFYNGQSSPYTQTILPNGAQTSPAILSHSSVYNGQESVINMLGKIDINPEFVRYKPEDMQSEGANPIALKVGLKISQPFMNATKNIDPKYAPQEYIYVDTDYFHFELGSVNSAASKMRVDAQKIASGNGGVFGTWWRYANLPVYNTNGLSTNDANALNAMSPVYMLYPTLPNEAGFTTQRGIVGQPITTGMFTGANPLNSNLIYGSTAQPYPTQGAYSNKISIYSKRIKGVKIGLSYSPNTAQSGYLTKEINGNTSFYSNTIGGYVKNYVAVAIDYRKQWDKYGIGIAVSATYEHGNVMPTNFLLKNNTGRTETIKLGNSIYQERYDLNAWNIGAQFVWKNYSIAYSYGDWGRSLLYKNFAILNGDYQVPTQGRKSYYHTLGLGANYGPVRLGLTYMRSNYGGNKLDAWSVGSDIKIISLKYLRVEPFFEYVGFHFHTPENQLSVGGIKYKAIKNTGFVISTGIRVSF